MPDLHELRQTLQNRLTRLLQRAAEIEDTLSDPGDPDWQENALSMEDDEALAAVGSLTRQEIQDIRLTLNRIENGTWGSCVSCGQAISPDRLAELPSTCHCSRCAQDRHPSSGGSASVMAPQPLRFLPPPKNFRQLLFPFPRCSR